MPDQGPVDLCRQSRAQLPGFGKACTGAAPARMHGEPRQLSQRNHAPRPCDLSKPVLPGKRALRHVVLGLLPDQRSEEHTPELQSLMRISYAVFCLKKKKT